MKRVLALCFGLTFLVCVAFVLVVTSRHSTSTPLSSLALANSNSSCSPYSQEVVKTFQASFNTRTNSSYTKVGPVTGGWMRYAYARPTHMPAAAMSIPSSVSMYPYPDGIVSVYGGRKPALLVSLFQPYYFELDCSDGPMIQDEAGEFVMYIRMYDNQTPESNCFGNNWGSMMTLPTNSNDGTVNNIFRYCFNNGSNTNGSCTICDLINGRTTLQCPQDQNCIAALDAFLTRLQNCNSSLYHNQIVPNFLGTNGPGGIGWMQSACGIDPGSSSVNPQLTVDDVFSYSYCQGYPSDQVSEAGTVAADILRGVEEILSSITFT